ncbi:hypothetical protein OXX69_008808 [Metschnikowia pulcherrima]
MRAEVAAERRANLLNQPEKQEKDEGEKSDDKHSSVKDSSVKDSIKDSPVKDSSVKDSSAKRFFDEDLSEEDFSDEDDCEEEWGEENPTEFEAAKKVLKQAISLYEKEYTKHEEDAKSLTEPYLNSDADVPKSRFVEIVKKLADTYDLLGDVMTEVEKPQCSSDHYDECLHLYQKLYHKEFSGHVAMAHYNYAREAGYFYDAMDDAAKHIKQAIRITANLRKVGDWEAKRSCTKLLIELDAEYTRLTRDIQPELDKQDSMTRALMSQFMSLGS